MSEAQYGASEERKIASVSEEIVSPFDKNSGGRDRVTSTVPKADLVRGGLAMALWFFERQRKGKRTTYLVGGSEHWV